MAQPEGRQAPAPPLTMPRLSRPLSAMHDSYSVVVVGSGYGGGVAASRLAAAGQSVCVLERGREIHPGEYPDTLVRAAAQTQLRRHGTRHGSVTGLFDMLLGDDMSVLVGCGLGGTSLINANVALRAKDSVFDPRSWPSGRGWPKELQGGVSGLEPFYERAETMLGSRPYPREWPELRKVQAFERSAKALDATVEFPKLNVTFASGPNAAGVMQQECVLCGDCVSGCNHWAKNTVLMNYLPYAHSRGAHIFTETAVRFVSRRPDNRWLVHFDSVASSRARFEGPASTITADVVVLAAGTLGSTEILLRSRVAGLPVSDMLGHRFSGNGDVLAFAYDTDAAVHGVGRGSGHAGEVIGPCITAMIDVEKRGRAEPALIMQDGVVPGALSPLLPAVLWASAAAFGQRGAARAPGIAQRLRSAASVTFGKRAVDHTLTYLVMADDDDKGRMLLDHDELLIEWPGVADRPAVRYDNDRLRRAATEIGGTFVPDPIWHAPWHHSLITVHPIGGCVMADSAENGVVNHKGQVFAGRTGSVPLDGLYVMDASVIPTPLGRNPLLTISALAERSCSLLAADRKWTPPP